jgi:N utilization substance protein A
VGLLASAGFTMLNDVLDLERDDILRVPGMTPELADQLVGFLAELTTDESESGEEAAPSA